MMVYINDKTDIVDSRVEISSHTGHCLPLLHCLICNFTKSQPRATALFNM